MIILNQEHAHCRFWYLRYCASRIYPPPSIWGKHPTKAIRSVECGELDSRRQQCTLSLNSPHSWVSRPKQHGIASAMALFIRFNIHGLPTFPWDERQPKGHRFNIVVMTKSESQEVFDLLSENHFEVWFQKWQERCVLLSIVTFFRRGCQIPIYFVLNITSARTSWYHLVFIWIHKPLFKICANNTHAVVVWLATWVQLRRVCTVSAWAVRNSMRENVETILNLYYYHIIRIISDWLPELLKVFKF